MKRKKKFVLMDTRSAVAAVATATILVLVCFAADAMDKAEAKTLAEIEAAKQQVVVQAVKPTPEAIKPTEEPEAETVMIFDVPLDVELQLFIIQSCEEHHIAPAIVIAMIQNESCFQSDVIGDSGNAFGLMQVWPKWHQERMDRLGVTDLLDPRQNVAVGMDYLFELLDRGNGLEWALMAYAAGPTGANSGIGSSYAARILANSEIMKEGMIEYAVD